MKKAWIVFALILIISAQLAVLTFFHEAEASGYSIKNSVITVAKWNYVDASFTVSVFPQVRNGTTNARLVLPNGTIISVTTPLSGWSQRFSFPRTGDAPFVNGAVSGPVPLSQEMPLNVVVTSEVSDVQGYVSSLSGSYGSTFPSIDFVNLIVYGEAQIFVSAYGVAL